MSATNFNTSNSTYRELIGNGFIYNIPPFQRDYTWEEEQWDDLWEDILIVITNDSDPVHYMGYLVLQTENNKTFDVIDGQQRLTTLSLIVLAVLKNLQRLIAANEDQENNKQRVEELRRTYIGYLDPVTLVSQSKLSLNRNNDNYFQTYIVPLQQLPVRGFKASEHNLRKAFEWFDRKVQDYIKKINLDKGITLATLVGAMSDRLFFTVINVTDELNAYKVFETLNSRGVRLSSTDLLKNHLFSVIHRENQDEHELKTLESRWESIVSRLEKESLPNFLRAHWLSKNKAVRHADLFKAVRSQVLTMQSVFDLLRGMEEDIDTYLSLTNPDSSSWAEALKDSARTLMMFNIRQPMPLLIAAHRKFSTADFESLLRACVVISYRYNVIGNLPPNEQENTYQQAAQKVSSGEYGTLLPLLEAMKSIYPSDDIFKATFTEKSLNTSNQRNSKIVKYTLARIERQVSNTEYDSESSLYTIEHVLPQNPEIGWETFSDTEAESMVYRLGNMALLESSKNRDIGNSAFSDKKPVLLTSVFELTKKVSEDNDDWTPDRITARQKSLAKTASSIWRIPQLS